MPAETLHSACRSPPWLAVKKQDEDGSRSRAALIRPTQSQWQRKSTSRDSPTEYRGRPGRRKKKGKKNQRVVTTGCRQNRKKEPADRCRIVRRTSMEQVF
ncbi:hypothetical protein V8C35DRAFT_298206 [Trichoderma chlorosporum]